MDVKSSENILAIDTATTIFSVALGTTEGSWYFEADAGTRHSQLLMEIIDTLFNKAGLKPADLSSIVCMKGPGSFTGLRIGYSCAKGLALGLNIPFFAVPSLDCMIYPYSAYPGLVIPVIDAKKNSFFCSLYLAGSRLTDDMDADTETIIHAINKAFYEQMPENKQEQVLLVGPDADKFHQKLSENGFLGKKPEFFLNPGHRKGSAKELLAIAKNGNISDNIVTDINSGPEYLRKSDAELNS